VVQPTTGYVETVNIDSSSSSQIDAYGTLRARIGWNAGWFMPFATGGLAVGKGSSAAAVTVTHSGVDADPTAAPTLPSFTSVTTANASRKNSYTFGWAAGAGVDVLIASNILLRAEYQYVKFGTAGGIPLDINTVRGAVGVKF
jgi:opacity protein-like surface antigen